MHLIAMLLLVALLQYPVCGHAGDPAPAQPAQGPESRVSVLTAEQVKQILDQTVDWYRMLGAEQQAASQTSDLLILYANRQIADKAVALAFDIARANAELLSSEANAGQNAADAATAQAAKTQRDQLNAQRQSIVQEINANQRALGGSGVAKQNAAAKLPELQGELAMLDARTNLLETMGGFVNQSNSKEAEVSALKAHIEAVAASIPAAGASAASSPANAAATSNTNAPATAAALGEPGKQPLGRYGLWDLAENVLQFRGKLKTIDLIDERTSALADVFRQISAAPLSHLKAYSARGDALASQADNASSAVLKDLRGEFDTLAWLFKQTSSILIPLSQEQVLLEQYRHNLGNWREAVRRQYRDALATLGVRLGLLAAILAGVLVLADIWRRGVNRYVHEPRRKYQLLLIRRILMWFVIIVIVGLSFVTQISTFATFAGLLTAGIAVAMQSVLVSIVGYFFLIGKYGIRVGDRVQIGSVVGEVIDIGLVRMHLMELNQAGPLGPTGRVVAFANLVVFQASGGLFKQLPGVNLSRHEMSLTLPSVSDYSALKEKLLAGLNRVVGDYREDIERQGRRIRSATGSQSDTDVKPNVQMHLVGGHMQATVSYPVHSQNAAEMDERVSQAILQVINP